jgi:hypothetical protein
MNPVGARLWTNLREIVTPPTQTYAPLPANVTAVGGGTTSPALEGGGIGFSREPDTPVGRVT